MWARHTSRFLIIWLMALPIAIWEVYGWATPVLAVVVSFFLLGIENIGMGNWSLICMALVAIWTCKDCHALPRGLWEYWAVVLKL